MERGFGETTMEDIAQEAGVGKATVYAHFGSKTELFAAVVREEGQLNAAAWRAVPGYSIERDLVRIGDAALNLILAPGTVAHLRSIATESRRYPELGQVYFDSGPAQLIEQLTAYLQRAATDALLDVEDPRIAASHFFGMLTGEVHLRCILGLEQKLASAHREHLVRQAVAAFVRAYSPRQRRSAARSGTKAAAAG